MQGGREPGRGVYAARRIVAALVILLLLILLIPRACQALFGPGEAPGPGASGTSITSEDTGGTENTAAEQENTSSSPSGGEIETEGGTGEISGAVSVGEIAEVPNIEPAANLIGMVAVPEAAVGGSDIVSAGATEPTPAPSVDTGSQLPPPPPPPPPPPQQTPPAPPPLPAVEPIAYEEPVLFEEPFPSEEPVTFQEEIPSNTTTTPTSNTFASVATDRAGPEAVAGAAVAIT